MPRTDFIADFLTVIRNAVKAKKEKVTIPSSQLAAHIAEILKEEGFIENAKTFSEGNKQFIRLHLKYLAQGRPAIQGIRRVSKPGLRVYVGSDEIPKVRAGLGISIVSTSKGVMTDRRAREARVGGELLCAVW